MAHNQITPKERLKRFLYTSNEHPKFIVGNAENHEYYVADKVKCVSELLQSSNPDVLLNVIEIVNSENLTPRRETLFFALAIAAVSNVTMQENKELFKQRLYTTLLNICKYDDDLFCFIKFYKMHNSNFGTALNRAIQVYYMKKEPIDLAKLVTKGTGYHGWKHKDLIKLSHCKTDNELIKIVIMYVMFGLKKIKDCTINNQDTENIISYLTQVETFKRCEDEKKLADLLTELKFSLKQVPSHFSKSKIIWEHLIPTISLNILLNHLPQLYKLGFLKGNGSLQTQIVEAFTNVERVKSSKMHPIEFFIGLRHFEKGGKPLDPKLVKHLESKECATVMAGKSDGEERKKIGHIDPPKCQIITSAINKAMHISYNNLQPTGKRYMITIDLSEKMNNSCLKNKNLPCIDAAVIFTQSIIKMEKEVTVAVFNDTKINPVLIERNMSFHQTLTKLRQAKKGSVFPTAVFDWAINKKKCVDVFINIMYYHHWTSVPSKEWREKEKPIEALNKYRKKMNLNAKLINFSLSTPYLDLADGSPNILDVCGFDKNVPKVVEAFCRGSFC